MEIINHKGKYYLKTETGYREVLATTDTSLKINNPNYDIGKLAYITLPQPSQQFIQKYIEEYNKGREIKEVLVEYEEGKSYSGNEGLIIKEWLKINPKYNTITIKKVKDSYSREEVIGFGNKVKEYCKDGWKSDSLHRVFFEWDKWVEETL